MSAALADRFWSKTRPEGDCLVWTARIGTGVKPEHLEAVTAQENSRRAEPAQRTHCPSNHEYTPENTRVRNGKRHCLACHRTHQANYLSRKAG